MLFFVEIFLKRFFFYFPVPAQNYFAIGLFVLRALGSGLNFATSLTLGVFPHVFLGPLAGTLADRINRKHMVVFMDILSGLIILGLLVLSLLHELRLPYIYITTFSWRPAVPFFMFHWEPVFPTWLIMIASCGLILYSIALNHQPD